MVDSFQRNSCPSGIRGMYSLRVDNISCRTTAGDLLAVFGRYGTVGDIYMPRDKRSGEQLGGAYVRYHTRRSAEKALSRTDGKMLGRRRMRVNRSERYGWPEPEQAHRHRSFDYASHRSGDTGGGSRRSSSPCRQRHHSRSRSNDREESRRRHNRFGSTGTDSPGPHACGGGSRRSPSPCRQRHLSRSRIDNREGPRPRRRRARSGSHSHAPHAGDGRGGSGQSSGGMSRSRCRSPYSSPDAARQVYFRSRSRSPTRSHGSPLHSSPQRSPRGARQRSYSRSRSLLRLAEQSLLINVHYL
ncbi:serine/arginine-rich splicing factor 2-like [Sycon ciliatum]|uniref:serine/arginine-rich splicing factor 2-like n=1 Tax=Sycon ciliatum TaxID=27933 RepID=UPI0031F6FC72